MQESPFVLQSTGQTLEKLSTKEFNLQSRKGTLSKAAGATQNEPQASSPGIVSLKDYPWPKGITSPIKALNV